MDNTTRYEIIGEGQYRVLAQGWWADVEYRWDRATDDWRVMIIDTNAYGPISLFDIGLAANDVIGGGEVRARTWSGQTRAGGSSMAAEW
jgi:hypothetical protein